MRPSALSQKVRLTLNARGGEPVIDVYAGFQDPSALLKHELAYCLGQMKNTAALATLESVLANEQEDPMVRHEVSPFTLRSIHIHSFTFSCP